MKGIGRLVWLGVLVAQFGCGETTTTYKAAPVEEIRLIALMDSVRPLRAQAIRAAVAEINDTGMLLGPDDRPIRLAAEVYVQEADPDDNAALADQLMQDRPNAFGLITSGSSHTLAVINQQINVPIMSGSATSDIFTTLNAQLNESSRSNRWFSRLAPPDRLQVSVLRDVALARGVRRIAILEEFGDAYAENLAEKMADRFILPDAVACLSRDEEQNAEGDSDLPPCTSVVLRAVVRQPNPSGLASILAPLENSPVDAILVAVSNVDLMIATLNAIERAPIAGKPNLRVLLVDASLNSALLQAGPFWLAGETAEGQPRVIGSTPQPSAASANYRAFESLMQSQLEFEGSIQRFTANYVDVIYVFALAAQAAMNDGVDPADPEFRAAVRDRIAPVTVGGSVVPFANGWREMRDTLRQTGDIDYSGASGNCDIDVNGDVVANYEIWTLERDPDPLQEEMLVRELTNLTPRDN